MGTNYTPPMAISFVWNPADTAQVKPILDNVKAQFARDKNRPFSRGLNIPLFFYSSNNCLDLPQDYPKTLAQHNIIFVFTSVNTLGIQKWRRYIDGFPLSDTQNLIPVAIDQSGLAHGGSLSRINCIRAFDWPDEDRGLHAVVALAHEVYRFGLNGQDLTQAGKAHSISIFLSHAKTGCTGRLHAEEIKRFIDNTNMHRFFDTTEISPGYQFDEEIEKHIANSTLLALESDAYSSRYWCQREILSAKQNDRPIVVVNCLEDYEDRVFPAASNVPCVHISPETPMSQHDILRVLSSTIVETIRFFHAKQCLEAYREFEWIPAGCELTSRPPEIRKVLGYKGLGKRDVCYPEPPVYSNEADWHKDLDVHAFTPLWHIEEKNILYKERVGISISDFAGDGYVSHHLHQDQLVRLAQDVSRHLLARSATLLYGGDLRKNGFTEFVLDEAMILQDRIGADIPVVENHLAWPLHLASPEVIAWQATYSRVMNTIPHPVPPDVSELVDDQNFLAPTTPENLYIWSRCLTQMRKQSINSSTVRICAGGKRFAYKGKMPGVLEETLFALDAEKPIYLLGGFGGIVADVCEVILGNNVPNALSEEWQQFNNSGYAELQKVARARGYAANYENIVGVLQKLSLPKLANSVGLSEEEYRNLMCTPFVDESLHLILKGLKNMRRSKGHEQN
ncbi:TIR domain-containing protein [Halopseudomonas sabulinigri]|uniref:TIR domain-containing protein n=1 Tax=Halopseudomonas sabulinigri TaxID=472181 RepID=A0A1H1PJ94_9GAMM|nr:TIR domain-containing protein [Halopseudomonas sabulinigri]SDS11316.1 TIR domain-containing protein [Halopseudomonas sabulinigri]